MAEEMKSNVKDEDFFMQKFIDAVQKVVIQDGSMLEAKQSVAQLWSLIPEERKKEIANKLFTRLARMETVVQSLVGEYGIMSIHQRT